VSFFIQRLGWILGVPEKNLIKSPPSCGGEVGWWEERTGEVQAGDAGGDG